MSYLDSLPLRTWSTGQTLTSTALNNDVYRPAVIAYQKPAALLWSSNTTTVESGATVTVPLDRYSFDTDNIGVQDAAVIRTSGLYEVHYSVAWTWTGAVDLNGTCWLTVNDTAVAESYRFVWDTGATTTTRATGGTVELDLSVNDRVAIKATCTSTSEEIVLAGSNLDGSEGDKCHLAVAWTAVTP